MENIKDRYVKRHNKISREVTEADIPRVMAEADIMLQLCCKGHGLHRQGGLAIAHPQIDDKDPPRFFVMRDGVIIINPEIIEHSDSKENTNLPEGCLTFPDLWENPVERYHKISVSYQRIVDGKLSERKTANYANIKARIWQHEIDHLNAKYVFPEEGIFKKVVDKIKETVGV